MIVSILSVILFLVFITLGSFHFYWFLGGSWGLDKVIPTKNNQTNGMPPPKLASLIVGLVLTLFGLIYLVKSGLIAIQIPNWVTNYAYWLIPSIFIIRAIGEFKYVGFFKKIKDTAFAKADSKIFSPLCLFIGIIGILIQLVS